MRSSSYLLRRWSSWPQQRHQRFLHHASLGLSTMPSIGYECASFLDRDYDLTLLEKSIRNGCKIIVEKSKTVDSIRTYDLLTDLSASDDADLQTMYLVHVLSSSITGQDTIDSVQENVQKELSTVQRALRSKTLNAITIPVSSALLSNKKNGTNDDTTNNQNWIAYNLEMIKSLTSSTTLLGLDLSTEWLSTAGEEDINHLLSLLHEDHHGKQHIRMLTIATNSYTHHHVSRIHQWLKTIQDHGQDQAGSTLPNIAPHVPIHTISTEILRCHPRRPGLLSLAGGKNKLSHLDPTVAAGDAAQEAGFTMNLSNTSNNTANADTSTTSNNHSTKAQLTAVATMQQSLNACVHAEKQLLAKIPDLKDIDREAVSWGHILSHTQHNILYPEEWDYFHTFQILPRLTATLEKMKGMDRIYHEWTLLYGPMANQLFASFALALETRRLSLCLDVFRILTFPSSSLSTQQSTQSSSQEFQSTHPTSSDQSYRTLPWSLATLAMSLGSDTVVIAGTEYQSNIQSNHQSNQADLLTVNDKKAAVEKVVNDAARKVFEKQTTKLAVDNVLLRMRKPDLREENNSSSNVSTGGRGKDRESNGEGGTVGRGNPDLHSHVVSNDVLYAKVKTVLESYAS